MLITRIISAAIGILYLIVMLYLRGWFFNISILLISSIGMYEFYTSLRKAGYNPIAWIGYVFMSIFFCFITMELNNYYGLLVLLLTTMACLAATIISHSITLVDVSLTILGCIYPGIALFSLLFLGNIAESYVPYMLILTFFATWSTDTFAYFIGIKFGKNKLCPNISPKKTVEGSIGGIVGSIAVSILVGWIFKYIYQVPLSFYHYIIISLLCGFTSQIGDLTASTIKRFCNIKDFGRILPGHGGLLDRFDSIMFTAPIVYVYYLLFLTP
jgi:phosphatidate cytidylyltransferase